MARQSLSYVLVNRPKDKVVPGETFHQKKTDAPTASDLKDGQILVETLYLSLDPAMRNWLDDVRSYVPPVKVGEVMRGAGIVRVLASKSKQAKEGDIVVGFSGWQEVAILPEGRFEPAYELPKNTKVTDLLGVLGSTGLTAYYGLMKIGDVKKGDTVVVSGAAGAVGSVVGQIAKILGAGKVIGIAGSDEKTKWLTEELGYDEALNYKHQDFEQKFEEATPKFIDVFWDNGQ
jgi:NADPH-dependent curcumin reductase CurA